MPRRRGRPPKVRDGALVAPKAPIAPGAQVPPKASVPPKVKIARKAVVAPKAIVASKPIAAVKPFAESAVETLAPAEPAKNVKHVTLKRGDKWKRRLPKILGGASRRSAG